jgi:hypothetical protein
MTLNWIILALSVVFQVAAIITTTWFTQTKTRRGREFQVWLRVRKEEKEKELEKRVAQIIESGETEDAPVLINFIREFKSEVTR